MRYNIWLQVQAAVPSSLPFLRSELYDNLNPVLDRESPQEQAAVQAETAKRLRFIDYIRNGDDDVPGDPNFANTLLEPDVFHWFPIPDWFADIDLPGRHIESQP